MAANAWAQDVIQARVLRADQELLRIRVAWIDAPELGQAFGRRAKQLMSVIVFGKDVELHPHGIDHYGRTVAMVFVGGRDCRPGADQSRPGLGLGTVLTGGSSRNPGSVLGR